MALGRRRGIGNPVRCAEAVYRHIIRNGASTADWRGPIGGRQSKLPFEPDRNPLGANLYKAFRTAARSPRLSRASLPRRISTSISVSRNLTAIHHLN
jgi:hypothetical protein